jgi:ribonucleoside-triphosphate reductase
MINTNKLIDDFINQKTWEVHENSNIPFSIMSLNNDLAEAAHKEYWLTRVYDEEIRRSYSEGYFHIHDLGFLTTYCTGWNIEDVLKIGFRGQYGRQASSPPKHLGSALGQLCNYLYTMQGEAAGAEAVSNFDTYLAPFIFFDDMTQEEVNQAVQVFIYNINIPTRVGGQAPFTNITLDQVVPKFMQDDYVLRGGEYTEYVYGDFQEEMNMLNRAWWLQRIKGDADGRPQPFPIETLNVTEDFNWEDETLFKAVALRGTPYFSNFWNSDMNPEDVRSMCCRLRIDNTELRKRGGGYFGSNPLTGSIGVVTMNLPLLAYLAKDKDEYFNMLETHMEIAKRSLELKRQTLEKLTRDLRLYPFSMLYLQGVYDRFGEYWKNHFNTIGLVGMNEACRNLTGEDIISNEGLQFAIETLDFMRDKCIQYQEETDNMFNLEATPAEGTSYKLARRDKERYPDIITSGTAEAPYYTNSTQLPVYTDAPLGFYLTHQNKLQTKYTGGTVFHIWNGEVTPRWEAVSKLVKRVAQNTELPYYTYSPTTSVCPKCGFIAGEVHTCPDCGSKCEVWQRVTGYFSVVDNWNTGKKQEFTERHHFTI